MKFHRTIAGSHVNSRHHNELPARQQGEPFKCFRKSAVCAALIDQLRLMPSPTGPQTLATIVFGSGFIMTNTMTINFAAWPEIFETENGKLGILGIHDHLVEDDIIPTYKEDSDEYN